MPNINKVKNQAALTAARNTFQPNTTIDETAKSSNISRSTLTYARLIIEFGSEDEIKQVEEGLLGLRPLGEKLRNNVPGATKRILERRGGNVWTDRRRESLQTDADLYARLGPVLLSLTELPQPKDMVNIVKGNNSRIQSVTQHLDAALNWLKEFEHEWRKHRELKSPENPADA